MVGQTPKINTSMQHTIYNILMQLNKLKKIIITFFQQYMQRGLYIIIYMPSYVHTILSTVIFPKH